MHTVLRSAALAAALALSAGSAQSQTFTFEGLGDGVDVPNGYAGLTWSNFAIVDVPNFLTPSGFQNSVVSLTNTAYNPFGDPASFGSATPFALQSAHFTAVWNDGLTLRVVGSLAGATVFSQSYLLNTAGPLFVDFGGVSVDDVLLEPSGGTPAGYSVDGTLFSMDDLTIATSAATVPEPGTIALVMTGLLGVGGVSAVRRRRA
jgi:hypothetical protein